jgi:hypothetical protein
MEPGEPSDDTPAAPARPSRRHRPAEDSVPPPRPADLSPAELRFTRQPATRWFSPGVLAASGLHVGVTSAFGSFLDKRELQQSRPCAPDMRYADREELWLDYVADTGDGFEATATVACQVAKPHLHVDGVDRPLPRGDILVLGGDEVYPSASTEGYENRLEGPWRAALPWTEPGPTDPHHPTVYAIPGNHDWYDGLTGFLRQFGQGRWLGGWRTHQTRSYFAVQLPHRWWLWGVDIQSDALIDEPQLEFFADVADRARPGDRLVLATAVPTWTQLERDPNAYRNLAYLERVLMKPAGIELKLTLAGDVHHYSRFVQRGPESEIGATHKITSGGGGAFLHPTHDLPTVAPIAVDPDDPGDVTTYELAERYPGTGRSRLLSLRALLLLGRNPSFVVVPGLVNLVLLWTVQLGLRGLEGEGATFAEAAEGWGWSDMAGGMFRTSLSALVLLVLFGGLWAFAKAPPWAPRGAQRYAAKTGLAVVHAAAQLVTIATAALVAITVADALATGTSGVVDTLTFALVASIVVFLVGGAACSLVVGAYLALAIGLPGLRAHANEAFAAARITGYKNFLRIHIDRTGALTVHALGIDGAVRRRHWRAVPEADSTEAAWIAPTRDEPRPRLIDEITIT